MKLNNKNLLKIIILISASLMGSASFAAKIDINEKVNEPATNRFLYTERHETQRQQVLNKVKKEYKAVLGLINQKEYQKAKEKLALLMKESPKQSVFYNLQAILYITDNKLVDANKSFQKAIELNPKNVQAYTALAKLALGNKRPQQAIQYANQALNITPQAINAYKVLADVMIENQGIDAVEEMLLKANEKVKGNLYSELEVLKLLSKVYANKKQPQVLLGLVADLVKRFPDNIDAESALASVQLVNQDIKGSEQTLRHIIAQHPYDGEHLFLLARLLGNTSDQTEEVITLLDKAALSHNNLPQVIAYKVNFLIKHKQFKSAFLTVRQFEEKKPKSEIGKILKGDVYLAEKKYAEALKNYQLAYQMRATTKLLDAMLKTMVLSDNSEQAIQLLKKEIAKNKDNLQLKFKLATLYQETENYNLAIKQYEAIRIKEKDNVIVLNNLAWAYSQQKKIKKALDLAKQAFEKAPKSATVGDTYGYILLKSGDYQKGLKILQQMAELLPQSPEIQRHLAEAYAVNHNELKAKMILQKLMAQNNPEKTETIKLMRQLKLE